MAASQLTIQAWHAAVAEWRRARDQYDADPTDDAAYYRLRAAEALIAKLRGAVREGASASGETPWGSAR